MNPGPTTFRFLKTIESPTRPALPQSRSRKTCKADVIKRARPNQLFSVVLQMGYIDRVSIQKRALAYTVCGEQKRAQWVEPDPMITLTQIC